MLRPNLYFAKYIFRYSFISVRYTMISDFFNSDHTI